jgi:DNA-binding IclR family transcriptional regulator
MSGGSRSGVAAVDRALAITAAFRGSDRALSLAELAARTGFYKSTILRLTASLERAGHLVRLDDGKWRPGPALSRLGALYQASFELRDYVLPVLRRLADETGETAAFYVPEGDVRVCLFRVDSANPVRFNVYVGDHLPMSYGVVGRVLTAFLDGQDVLSERIRRDLVYAAKGEISPEIGVVSSPVFDRDGRTVGAIGISTPMSRYTETAVARQIALIKVGAASLTHWLGGDPSAFESKEDMNAPAA